MAIVRGITKDRVDQINASILSSASLDSEGRLVVHPEVGAPVTVGRIADDPVKTTPSLVSLSSFDFTATTVIVPEWAVPQVGNPSLPEFAQPVGALNPATRYSWSPDSRYFTAAQNLTPFITTYKRSGNTFTKLADPTTLPPASVNDVEWSPNGQHLAVGHGTSPFLSIYKRSGDVLTKLANPAVLPPAQAVTVSWSPDGTYLAVGHQDSASYVIIYKRSGDTFTRLATLDSMTYLVTDLVFSPNGAYLAVGIIDSPFIQVYKRSGDTFTLLPNVVGGNIPSNYPIPGTMTWDSSGKYLIFGLNASPYLQVYSRLGDVFTKVSYDVSGLSTEVVGIDFSPDGRYLAFSHGGSSPVISIYRFRGSYLQRISSGHGLQVSLACAFSPDGMFLVSGTTPTSDHIMIRSAGVQPKGGVPVYAEILP